MFEIQATESWHVFPGRYFHLICRSDAIYVMHLSSQSPKQVARVGGHGVGASVVRAAFSGIANRHADKLANKIIEFREGDLEALISKDRYSYKIPSNAIKLLVAEVWGVQSEGLDGDVTIRLRDRSGPFLQRDKRKFRFFPLEPFDFMSLKGQLESLFPGRVQLKSTLL